ncbi:protein SPO16 homolog [Cavia porcellus]|uniref:protein SPO16 homolog n=1 Tax=Cavia porcellus TaxID=10141 RepID=UPI002FDF75AF
MAESGEQERIKWTTTVIISSSLKNYEIAAALENQSHKVRYSDSVENGSIIFSVSGVAFLLMDAKECIMSAKELFVTKIEKFLNIHQNSFLVLFAALYGHEEWKLIFRIQQRFLGSKLRILPVHNTANAVNLMCTIAKTTSKPYMDSICYRMITTKAYIIEQSPVWKTLQKIKLIGGSINPN